MNSPQIFGTQVILSFVTYGLMARWYVSPRSRPGVDKPDDCMCKYMQGSR
jgi:hypothetical protein